MEYLLRNGDYVPDGRGGLEALLGAEEVLQRVLFRLQCRRGAFPFLPELGSQLYLLPREKPGVRQALCERYVRQALEPETDIEVERVVLSQSGADMDAVTVYLTWQGETLTAVVELRGKMGQ